MQTTCTNIRLREVKMKKLLFTVSVAVLFLATGTAHAELINESDFNCDQSGEKDVTSGITRAGDEMVRTALYEAANVLLSRITRFSKLKRWGIDVAKRRGSKRAKVALARKIAVILHRIWVDGSTYRWTETQPIAAQA